MDNISQETFRESLNTKFTANVGDAGNVELELIDCRDLGSTAKQEQFSLTFRGPRQPFLEQMTYELNHDAIGETLIFLVPVRQDETSMYYEAIFNRFTQENK